MSKQLKPIPKFANEAEEQAFWEKHDSTDYLDWTKAQRAVLPNLKPTTKTISLRLPQHLLDSIKAAANSRDVPYQSLIKVWLQEKLHSAGQREGMAENIGKSRHREFPVA
jgi:predicted DNA binding CopG/RHH family protein